MELATDTLRLELEPFGVEVLCVVTGAVQTNDQPYFENWKLPEDSLYKPIKQTILSHCQGQDSYKRMPLQGYLSNVVDQICRRATGKYWYRGATTSVKWGTSLFPQSLFVGYTLLQLHSCLLALSNEDCIRSGIKERDRTGCFGKAVGAMRNGSAM